MQLGHSLVLISYLYKCTRDSSVLQIRRNLHLLMLSIFLEHFPLDSWHLYHLETNEAKLSTHITDNLVSISQMCLAPANLTASESELP